MTHTNASLLYNFTMEICWASFCICVKTTLVYEAYKNCRVMSAFFRFSIITSSCSELASVFRSVRRAMLRRSHFFPLEKKPQTQCHNKNNPISSMHHENYVEVTGSFLLCFCLKEIHAHNESIQPCWAEVKEVTDGWAKCLVDTSQHWRANFRQLNPKH